MKPDDSLHERLLRLLDGRLDPADRIALESELRTRPEARTALRELAEQAVMISDVERSSAARRHELPSTEPEPRFAPASFWRFATAACLALSVLALGASTLWFRSGGRELGRVVKVTGAGSYFGTRGAATDSVRPGIRLRAGDILETRSCDSWIEVELRDGTHLTIAGQSTLRLLSPSNGTQRFELPRGNLWSSPATNANAAPLFAQTPSAALETRGSQFDLQSASEGTLVRVNRGSVRTVRNLDQAADQVMAGQQSFLTLAPGNPPRTVAQPSPVMSWVCNVGGTPEVLLGRWLPPLTDTPARLAAVPLLWPVPDRPPVTLHAVAMSVLRSSGQPVLLQAGSHILFRGQTSRPQTVRLGFSTQRMRGVFAGKFELDIPSTELGPPDQPWEVVRPIRDFRPLQSQPAVAPEGLELYDLYALTIQTDASLEIHHVEVTPGPASAKPR